MRTRSPNARVLVVVLVAALVAASCSGNERAGTDATTLAPTTAMGDASDAGETTTTVTTLPVVVGTTLPSVPLAYQVRSATLGDCDWPEEYPADADPLVVTINDVDGRTDLAAAADGLPAWEIPIASSAMTDAGMLAYGHRTVRLYGTTLVGGAYLFDDSASASAHLAAIEATFGDAELMGLITGAGPGFVDVESPSPGAFSLTDGIPPEQEYDDFVSVRVSAPSDERATYVIDGYAWHTGDTVGFLRAAYPANDGTRGWAATVAAGEMIGRSGGPQFGFFKEPLTTVPDLGLLLEAVLATGDTFDGDTYELIGDGFFYDVGSADLKIPFALEPEFGAVEWPATQAQMRAAGIVNTAVTPRTQWGASGPVMTAIAHRYQDEASATAAFEAIAGRTVTIEGLFELGILRGDELAAVDEPVTSSLEPGYWEGVLRHPDLITIVPLDVPRLGDQTVGVLFSGPDADGPAREKVHLVWRTGSHLQILKVSAEFGTNPDTLLGELYRLAGDLQVRAAQINAIPAPAAITGLENYTGYDARVYPKCQPEEATLDGDPWLTASAVVIDSDPWILPITADGGESIVLSRSQLEALSADEVAAIETYRTSLGLIDVEVPTDLDIWDETGLRAFAHRIHISDGNANATLVSGAYRYEDAAAAEWSFVNRDGGDEYWKGWFTTSRDRGLRSATNLLLGTRGDPNDDWESFDGANMPMIRSNGSEQSAGTLRVAGDDGYQVVIVQWVNGEVLQFLRARIPLTESDSTSSVTLDAFWEVYQAIGQRFPCSNPRTLVDEAGNLSDSLTGEACD